MTKQKIIYNPVIHDTLNKFIEFKPNIDSLQNSTNNVLETVFKLKEEIQPQTAKNLFQDKNSEKKIKQDEKIHLKDKIQNDNNALVSDEEKVKKSIEKNEKSSRDVLAIYINDHIDLETKIAYLKSYASADLLKNVKEALAKKKHEEYVKMIQYAAEVHKEEYIQNHHEVLKHKSNEHEDDFTILNRLHELFKDFDHEKDDHIEYIKKNLLSTSQNIKPLICLIKEFKNVIENPINSQNKSGITNDQGKTNNVHQNKVVQLLYDKYMNSHPTAQKDLLKALDNLHLTLEMKQNEILNKQETQKRLKQNLNR